MTLVQYPQAEKEPLIQEIGRFLAFNRKQLWTEI